MRKDNYRNLEKQLKESGENQISISDPQSRQNHDPQQYHRGSL